MWHVVDVRCISIRELAAALAKETHAVGWLPRISWWGFLRNREQPGVPVRGLPVWEFPVQRGFARFPIARLVHEGRRIACRIRQVDCSFRDSPLIMCSPHYAEVARYWSGPKLYYATDMFRFCGESRRGIERMERVMCRDVDLICPNSGRIAEYMIGELGVPREKIVIIPNATRLENMLPCYTDGPFPLPVDVANVPRPIAGVIGNLAANMDWELLREVVERTPWLSWVFVGPTEMPVHEPAQRDARHALMERCSRTRFVGPKPYGELRDYARALDVAILPYRKREPTYSGSSTRFYEHLAACRPMVSTRGFEELLHKEPLLRLVDTAQEMVVELERLRRAEFRDGHEELRWKVSRSETWEVRASAMRTALSERLSPRCTGVSRYARYLVGQAR